MLVSALTDMQHMHGGIVRGAAREHWRQAWAGFRGCAHGCSCCTMSASARPLSTCMAATCANTSRKPCRHQRSLCFPHSYRFTTTCCDLHKEKTLLKQVATYLVEERLHRGRDVLGQRVPRAQVHRALADHVRRHVRRLRARVMLRVNSQGLSSTRRQENIVPRRCALRSAVQGHRPYNNAEIYTLHQACTRRSAIVCVYSSGLCGNTKQ